VISQAGQPEGQPDLKKPTALRAAFAATEHRARGHAATYYAAPAIVSDACQPVGPPCRTHPDGW
jgi:hypothetical protein